MDILIRPETTADIAAIEQITIAAFAGKSYSDQTEHLVVNALREVGALSLSLVAEVKKESSDMSDFRKSQLMKKT